MDLFNIQCQIDSLQQQIDQLRSMIPIMPHDNTGAGNSSGKDYISGNDSRIVFTPRGNNLVMVDVYYV